MIRSHRTNAILPPLFAASLPLAVLLFLHALPAATAKQAEPLDLVIIGARVVDGTGNPWFYADVAVKDGRIVRVGRVDETMAAAAKRRIDGKGLVLAPGFIDVHAHTEEIYMSPDNRAAENFVRMGVTSLVTGNCGGSRPNIRAFLDRIKEKPLAVNVGTLIGHNEIRRTVLAGADRAPTPEEQARMEALVAQGMEGGALGLSTGLIYKPGMFAKTDEIVGLAKVVARHGGIYATHMRSEASGVKEAIRESIAIGEQAGIPVQISHFKVSSKRLWGKSDETLGMVREARQRGLSVTVDQYVYTASSTSLKVLLPNWAEAGTQDDVKSRLKDRATLARIVRDMRESLQRDGFSDYSYAVVASYAKDRSFNGKSIVEITRRVRGKDDLDSQTAQILEMIEAGGASMIYHKMAEEDVQRILREPFTMIASDSGVRGSSERDDAPHPRGYGNNVRVLGRYVRDLKLVSLEDAVRKMTSLPAQTFGLRDRGQVREGFAADLVLFDPATVRDRATFEKPYEKPEGIAFVVVNGLVVLEQDRLTEARPGVALRRGSIH
jgi:N-acyl-D-amino-acid deacylase